MTDTLDDIIDKQSLDDALRKMGAKHVKPPYRERWTSERPTTGYCYVLAELAFHYLAPEGSKPHLIHMENGDRHWFVRTPEGENIDLSADQIDEPFPYELGKPRSFMTPKPSKRARRIAGLLGLIEPEETS